MRVCRQEAWHRSTQASRVSFPASAFLSEEGIEPGWAESPSVVAAAADKRLSGEPLQTGSSSFSQEIEAAIKTQQRHEYSLSRQENRTRLSAT